MRFSKKVRSTSQIKSSVGCGYDVTIKNCFHHGCFIRTKQEVNHDVIKKPADLSEEIYEAWIEVDPNLETAERTTGERICHLQMNRRDDDIELEDIDEEDKLEEKPPPDQGNLQAIRTSKKISQIPYWIFR
ncbi:hypothetical protein AVEN_270230-1 [Araneus ventricosus]|uniref:Uncharacterized protein n=1 Tax=Araneus ventricosus TaxID=182803 RepID=A0A4Y2G0R9_ARAVE|nr:hypothetical protein AVEN_270230-1 [Araneus ventricosus]